MRGPTWSQPEIDYLLELAGDHPFPMLCRMYNRMAGKEGWPLRSKGALRCAIYRYGSQSYTTGEWLTINQASVMLGGSDQMVRYWVMKGYLPARSFTKAKKAYHYISRSDLRKLARERPQVFGGQTEATLNELLCDEALSEHIAANYPRRMAVAAPVICIETGRRYPSIKAAARANYVTHQALQYAIKQQKPIDGRHWQFANPKHQADAIAKAVPRCRKKNPPGGVAA